MSNNIDILTALLENRTEVTPQNKLYNSKIGMNEMVRTLIETESINTVKISELGDLRNWILGYNEDMDMYISWAIIEYFGIIKDVRFDLKNDNTTVYGNKQGFKFHSYIEEDMSFLSMIGKRVGKGVRDKLDIYEITKEYPRIYKNLIIFIKNIVWIKEYDGKPKEGKKDEEGKEDKKKGKGGLRKNNEKPFAYDKGKKMLYLRVSAYNKSAYELKEK